MVPKDKSLHKTRGYSVSVVSLPIALMFAKLSATIPDAGGVSSFVRKAMGNTAGDIAGWLYLWIIPIGQPTVVLSGLFYAQFVLHLPNWSLYILAWVILSTAGVINITGTKVSIRLQSIVVALIIILLLVTITAGLAHAHSGNFHPLLLHGWAGVGAAGALIMWAYVGWENVSSIAEDFKNPARDFIISVVISVIVISFLYTGTTAAVIGVIPHSKLASTTAPLAAVLSNSIGSWAGWVAAAISIMIVAGSAIAFIWGGSSLAASLARSKSLPKSFSVTNNKGSFYKSVLALMSVYTIVLLAFYLHWLNLDLAAKIVGGSAIITYGLAAISYLRLIRPLSLKNWISPAITALFVIVLLPFFGKALLFQLAIVIAYLVSLAIRNRYKNEEFSNIQG